LPTIQSDCTVQSVLQPHRLRALQAVVEAGSVREAAARLGYSPSAISQHIAALQAETRSVLLEPAGRGVRPTPAGRLLSEHARAIFERLALAEAELDALNAGRLGTLRLATFATAGAELVPPALVAVRAALPELDITLRSAERDEALGLLRGALIDIALIEAHDHPAEPADGLVFQPLLRDPFRLLLPRGHRLARRRVIDLAEVADEPWIDLRCEVDCCKRATAAAFLGAGFEPRYVAQADEYWPAQSFVAAGLGLALVPGLALGVNHSGVVARRLAARGPCRHTAVADGDRAGQDDARGPCVGGAGATLRLRRKTLSGS
jgi:DNA-binding transcriptional LysR family regulator